jgi:ankyrin repeat protein
MRIRWQHKLHETYSHLLLAAGIAVLLWPMVNLPQLSRLACSQSDGDAMLLNAAAVGDIDGVREALRLGIDPDATDRDCTALMLTSDPSIARLLLDRGANPNVVRCHRTPLLSAIPTNNLALVRVLLDAGADPNQHEPAFAFPLEVARMWGAEQVERLLLSRGACEVVSTCDQSARLDHRHPSLNDTRRE